MIGNTDSCFSPRDDTSGRIKFNQVTCVRVRVHRYGQDIGAGLIIAAGGGLGGRDKEQARGPGSELVFPVFSPPEAPNITYGWFVLLTASKNRGSDIPDVSRPDAVKANTMKKCITSPFFLSCFLISMQNRIRAQAPSVDMNIQFSAISAKSHSSSVDFKR